MRQIPWFLSAVLLLGLHSNAHAGCETSVNTLDFYALDWWQTSSLLPCPETVPAVEAAASAMGLTLRLFVYGTRTDTPDPYTYYLIHQRTAIRSIFIRTHGSVVGITTEYFQTIQARNGRYNWYTNATTDGGLGWNSDWLLKLDGDPGPRIVFRSQGVIDNLYGQTPDYLLLGLFTCDSEALYPSWGEFAANNTAFYYDIQCPPDATDTCWDLNHVFRGMSCQASYPDRGYRAIDQIPSRSPETNILQIVGNPQNALNCNVDCNNRAVAFDHAGYSDGAFRWVTTSEEINSTYELLGYPDPSGQPLTLSIVPGQGADAPGVIRAYEVPLAAPYPVLQVREKDTRGRWTYSRRFEPSKGRPKRWDDWRVMAAKNFDIRTLDTRTYGPPVRRWIRDENAAGTLYPAHVVMVSSSEEMLDLDLLIMTRQTPHWEDGLNTGVVQCLINGDPLEARQCLVEQSAENQAWNAANPSGRQYSLNPTLFICGDEDFVNYMVIGDPRETCVGNCISYSKIGDLGGGIVCPVLIAPADDEYEIRRVGYAAKDWNNGDWVNEAVGVMIGDGWSVNGGGFDPEIVLNTDIVDNTYHNSGVPVAGVLLESEHPGGTRRAAGQNMINSGLGELWFAGHQTDHYTWTDFLTADPGADSYPMNELSTHQRVMVYGPSCKTVHPSTGGALWEFVRAGWTFDAAFRTSWAGVVGHMNADYGPGHDAFIRYLLDELANIPPGVRKPMAVVVRDVILDLEPQFGDYAWGCTFMGGYALTPDHDFVPIGISEAQLQVEKVSGILRTSGTVQEQYAPLRFALAEPSRIKLRVYNAQGRAITTVLDRDLSPGDYTYHWNAGEHARGVYFVTLEVNGKVTDKEKLVNLR